MENRTSNNQKSKTNEGLSLGEITVRAGFIKAAELRLISMRKELAVAKMKYGDTPENRMLEGYVDGFTAALFVLNIGDYRD